MLNGRNISVLAVCTQMISARGRPQNKADSPRTNCPSERSSSVLGGVSGIITVSDITMLAARLKRKVGVILQSPLVIIQQPHGFGRLHPVGFDGLVNLRFHQ